MSHTLAKRGFTPRMPQVIKRRAEVAHLRSAGTIMAKRLVRELKEQEQKKQVASLGYSQKDIDVQKIKNKIE